MDELPWVEVLSQEWIAKGSAIGFEILFTYRRGGQTCKTLMRVLYRGTVEYTICEQGASLYEYAVFFDTFEFMYSTFAFGDLMAFTGLYQPE